MNCFAVLFSILVFVTLLTTILCALRSHSRDLSQREGKIVESNFKAVFFLILPYGLFLIGMVVIYFFRDDLGLCFYFGFR